MHGDITLNVHNHLKYYLRLRELKHALFCLCSGTYSIAHDRECEALYTEIPIKAKKFLSR